jgi:hypothetical protein
LRSRKLGTKEFNWETTKSTEFAEAEMQNGSRAAGTHLHFELILLLLWRGQARFDGLEAIVHLLEEALEFF